LFKSLLKEIIKMQTNKLFLAMFGAGTSTGDFFSNLFSGKKALGGGIPGGKFGIVGERGPEIVTGPANVTSTKDTAAMLGGGTQVTYNINAVDAQSFKQLVAADPEFIYAVTRRGAQRV